MRNGNGLGHADSVRKRVADQRTGVVIDLGYDDSTAFATMLNQVLGSSPRVSFDQTG